MNRDGQNRLEQSIRETYDEAASLMLDMDTEIVCMIRSYNQGNTAAVKNHYLAAEAASRKVSEKYNYLNQLFDSRFNGKDPKEVAKIVALDTGLSKQREMIDLLYWFNTRMDRLIKIYAIYLRENQALVPAAAD